MPEITAVSVSTNLSQVGNVFVTRATQADAAGDASDLLASAAEPVFALLLEELRPARREEVVHPVRLADEVEVVDVCRIRRSTDRCKPRIRDRCGRQTDPAARVVGIVTLEVGLLEGLCAGNVPAVPDRRVDP